MCFMSAPGGRVSLAVLAAARGRVVALLVAGLLAVAFDLPASASSAGRCPNEALREQQSEALALPDCRAYEQVTPVDKNGLDAELGSDAEASPSGGALTFFSNLPFPVPMAGASQFETYLSTRGAGGWSTEGLLAPTEVWGGATINGWGEDLSGVAENVSSAELPGAVPETDELYLRDSATGAYRRIVPTEGSVDSITPDGSYLIFETSADLGIPGAAAGKSNVYEWDSETEQLSLAGVLPESEGGAAPSQGSIAGPYDWLDGETTRPGEAWGYYMQNVVSADGSRVFFTAAGTGQLYAREDPGSAGAATVRVSASEKTNGGGPGGSDVDGPRPAAFMAATPDGSDVFFTSHEELTNDANTGPVPGVGRSNLDGSSPQQGFIPASAKGVAVSSEYVYWANPEDDAIGRARIDGSEIDQSFITGASDPQYVALYGGYLYWTNAAEGKQKEGSIGRARIGADGAEAVEESFIAGASDPQGIAVNAEYVYWANLPESSSKQTIARAKIDGEEVELTGFLKNSQAPGGVAVSSEYIYWTVPSADEIGRAPIGGGKGTADFITGASDPQGIAVSSEYVYWVNAAKAEEGAGSIARAPLAGGVGEPPLVMGANDPQGVALDGAHLYWTKGGGDEGSDLYRYDFAAGAVTDLTPDPVDPDGAEVLGVLGVSEDGSYVYFAANEVLAGNEGANGSHASPGDCEVNGQFINASCNLYLWHDGETMFIAPLHTGGIRSDWFDWTPSGKLSSGPPEPKSSRVSPDGTVLLFASNLNQTSYESRGHAELYRYEAPSQARPNGRLTCVSCDPAGIPPRTEAANETTEEAGQETTLFASPENAVQLEGPHFLTRNLAADGSRVFFDSSEVLLPQDTDEDGVRNAYEWEREQEGSCEHSSDAFSASSGGCLYLLSTGQSPEPSYFVDASASGEDAFIDTSQPLVALDDDTLV